MNMWVKQMDGMTLTIELPDELAQEAREFGLLDSQAIVSLLRAEVDRRVMDFVNAEIQAYRAEKAAQSKPPTSLK